MCKIFTVSSTYITVSLRDSQNETKKKYLNGHTRKRDIRSCKTEGTDDPITKKKEKEERQDEDVVIRQNPTTVLQ